MGLTEPFYSPQQLSTLTLKPENLPLWTIQQGVTALQGLCVSFHISTPARPQGRFRIQNTFTTQQPGLSEYTYPITQLQTKYHHLKGIPLSPVHQAQPTLLIGSDHVNLIIPLEPVQIGPPGGPVAVKTRLGWALQGPAKYLS